MNPNQVPEATQIVQTAHAVAVTVHPFVLDLITFAKALIMPCMFVVFVFAIVLRALIYYTVAREQTFATEFEKRANHFLKNSKVNESYSLFLLCKRLLEKTYYEMFEMRSIHRRRKLDHIMDPADRVFLIQPGMAYLVRDTMREIQFIKYDGSRPPLMEIVKGVFANNPCFSRVFGYLSVSSFNDFLNIIPGLFIVAGIFGTFLGIMQALPELGAMDIRDPESTKLVMDTFLAKIAFSMSTSTVGIMLSVISTIYNNFVSPERLFIKIVDRFERNLFRLWSRCDNNRLPQDIPEFDEHRDAQEALAAMSLDKAILSAEKRNPTERSSELQTDRAIPKRAAAPPATAPRAAPPGPPPGKPNGDTDNTP